MNISKLKELLISNNQLKLASELANITDQDALKLHEQISKIDWNEFKMLKFKEVSNIKPSKVITLTERNPEYKEIGIEAYKKGEVAALMVAGGQGSRLGYDGPKGCYKIGAVSKKSLYQIHAEKVLAISLRFGTQVPFLIMTSPATDQETRAFFQANNNFGLAADQVRFFKQGIVPSLDFDGNLLLQTQSTLVTNPDGHGGCFTALSESGLLNQLHNSGIKHLMYIQVDNALAPIYDPFLIGLAISNKADVITKVVEKCSAEEKVGILVNCDGKDTIKEYIDLPKEILEEKLQDGKLKYSAGNTAMHYWSVDFLNNKSKEGFKLPLHASKKPLKVWKDGKELTVEGYKYERFIFDIIPEALVSFGLEVDRREEFAPLKNKEGNDSPTTVNQLCSDLYKSWIKESGISLSDAIEVEISPLLALDKSILKDTLAFDPELKNRIESSKGKIYLD